MSPIYRSNANAVTYTNKLDSIVPTLYIGLGGTGKEILMRFRRRLYEDHGHASLPFARTIVFDTDMQEKSDIPKGEEEANYEHVRLSKTDGEWISVEIKPDLYQQAKADLKTRRDRRYTPWMHPEFFEIVPEKAVQDGAGGYRQAGRLAFFIHYRRIRTAIESELATMLAYMRDPNQQTRFPGLRVYNNRIEIVIIASIAGGTGAGMFLDMAYLVRDIMSTTPKFPKRLAPFDPFGLSYNVTLMATLPTAYGKKDAVMKDRFYMNAYSALLEMEHYNTPRPEENFFEVDEEGVRRVKHRPVQFRVNWEEPGGNEQIIEGTPWHTCYIIDDVNDKNRGSERELGDVHQMVADYLFLDLGDNAFSTEKRSVRANHAVLFSNTVTAEVHDPAAKHDGDAIYQNDQILYENKYGCSFSSFGLGEIYVDPERITRCASYRLASRLIEEAWIGRADEHGANRFAEWADDDLYGLEAGEGDEALTFSGKDLTRAILKEDGHDWIERINGMFDRLEKLDPSQLSGQELETQLRKVLTMVRGSIDGNSMTTGERLIEQTLRHRSHVLQGIGEDMGPLRRRLDRRTRQRFSQIGVVPILRLLEDYEQRLTKSRSEAAAWAKERVATVDGLLARLIDSLRVPFVLRKTAVRIEFQRACKEGRREVMRWCRNAAAKYLDSVYHTSHAYLRKDENDRQSLENRYTAWRELLKASDIRKRSIAPELDKQFDLFRKQPETDRRIAMVPTHSTTKLPWNRPEYDDEINVVLKRHPEVGPDPDLPVRFDWRRFEKLALRSQSVIDRCSRVEELFRNYKRDPTSLQRLVEEIALACRRPLGRQFAMHHFADGNIAAYLIQREDRFSLLKRLADGSAPYIPSIGTGRRREVVPIWRGLLGATPGDTGTEAVALVVEDVARLAAEGSDDPPRDTIDDDRPFAESRLILHREVGGIPAHFYARLSDLRQAYERCDQNYRCTTHVRWREASEDLPDIVMLSDTEYEQIANQVNDVIRGILLRYISCSDEGMFFVQVPHEFMTKTYELGSRINRIVKHACRLPEVRSFLQKRWAKWRDQVAKAPHLAVFYNSIQQNLRQFPSSVPAGQNNVVIPPLYNCLRKLLHTTEQDLRAAPDGERFFDLLHHRDHMDPDFQEWKDRFEAICEHVRRTCLVTACSSFPILQIDDKKIGDVRFFEEPSA